MHGRTRIPIRRSLVGVSGDLCLRHHGFRMDFAIVSPLHSSASIISAPTMADSLMSVTSPLTHLSHPTGTKMFPGFRYTDSDTLFSAKWRP